MPRMLKSVAIVLTLLALIPLALLVKARVTHSPSPRLMVIPDMDNQDRYKTQQASPFFADGRVMRAPPAGTVARGEILDEPAYALGHVDSVWVESFPRPLDAAALARGRERYGIHCAPCHGLAGAGDGMIARRADFLREGTWTPTTDLRTDAVRERPLGRIYDTIANGIRKMPAYGPQIPMADRWAIAGYVRALQIAAGGREER
ncbi:cytochrome c [bacterium]|nr:cytochrome c [bacterium]MBU1674372.1 cytochrome c [bacterium]